MNRIIEKLKSRYISKTKKNQEIFTLRFFLVNINKSGPEGVEPSTRSFGDSRSTAELRPYFCFLERYYWPPPKAGRYGPMYINMSKQ